MRFTKEQKMAKLQKKLLSRPTTPNKKNQAILEAAELERKSIMNEQKLILDQPETVTTKGVVEQVVVEPLKSLNEAKPAEASASDLALINEDPMSGIEIILRD